MVLDAGMKECFKCKRHLPLDEYYKHPQMGDGHLNKCKDCTKSDSEKRRKIKEQDPLWVLSERKRHREKTRRYLAQGKKFLSKDTYARTKKFRDENPEKYKAHGLVNRALRSGKLHRHPCCICGAKAQAHHEDYSKPLEVIWFCPKHHGEHHANKRDSEIVNK